MTYKQRAAKLAGHTREGMRFAAMQYRQSRRRGEVAFMIQWLLYAITYRQLTQGWLEEAA